MKIIADWSNGETQIGRWIELKSEDTPNRLIRIGLLFPKGSSKAKQFMAVEGVAVDEK